MSNILVPQRLDKYLQYVVLCEDHRGTISILYGLDFKKYWRPSEITIITYNQLPELSGACTIEIETCMYNNMNCYLCAVYADHELIVKVKK